jgi:hypothetical protein
MDVLKMLPSGAKQLAEKVLHRRKYREGLMQGLKRLRKKTSQKAMSVRARLQSCQNALIYAVRL